MNARFLNIRIVLVQTSHPGNIGSVARAMKTMGLTDLVLVAPKIFPDAKALELAAGADDILQNARLFPTLLAAISDCACVIGTSARVRELDLPPLTPRACAALVLPYAEHKPVAIVFGRESSGLSNEELALCQYQVMIPTAAEYSALNLAAAVQVIAYELRVAALGDQPINTGTQIPELATIAELHAFYDHLADVLHALDFYDPRSSKRLIPRLQRLFNRIRLEKMEVSILRGILKTIMAKIT